MATVVALLRGINVGGHNRVTMADVRHALDAAGHGDVTTYLQSGNVIVNARARSASAMGAALEQTLHQTLGLDIDVIVRSESELTKIARQHPLLDPKIDPAYLHVAFLKQRPSAAAVRALSGVEFGRDEFLLRGSEIYLRYPDGSGRSKMSAAFFEKKLGTPATARNWKVVTALAELVAKS